MRIYALDVDSEYLAHALPGRYELGLVGPDLTPTNPGLIIEELCVHRLLTADRRCAHTQGLQSDLVCMDFCGKRYMLV